MNKRKGIHILLRTLMVCCVIGIVYLSYGMYTAQRDYDTGDAVYAELREIRDTPLPVQPAAPEAPAVNFAALRAVSPDTTAWLHAEDSVIDYPVVQGTDNAYYLTHLFTGEKNKLGAIFMDYRSASDFSDKCTAIYGHHMKDGSMFTDLVRYRQQDYYESHPVMHLYTPEQTYTLRLFAGVIGDGAFDFVRTAFDDEADFMQYAAVLQEASTFRSDVAVEAADRLIALVTCTYEFDNARYVLFGKLEPAS